MNGACEDEDMDGRASRLPVVPPYCIGLLVFMAALLVFSFVPVPLRGFVSSDAGGALFNGVWAPGMTFSMPGEALARYLLKYKLQHQFFTALLPASCLALFYAVSRLLNVSRAAALLACAALLVFSGGLVVSLEADADTFLFMAAFLSATAAALWREREFEPLSSALTGFFIGASLWFRSTLFFLPLLLLAHDWIGGRYRSAPFFKHAAALVLLPAMFLLPWPLTGLVLDGRFSIFEHGRADCNLLAGALGLTMTTEGDIFQLAGLSHEASALGWALSQDLTHPIRFAAAFLRRAYLVFSWYAPLFLAFGFAVLRYRKRREFVLAGSIVCCWFALHCAAMPVERRYFIALLPFLAAGTVSLVGLQEAPAQWQKELGPVFSAGAFVPAAVALLAAALWAAYPARVESFNLFKPALALSSADKWLLSQESVSALQKGRVGEALALSSASLSGGMPWPELLLNRGRVLLCGSPAELPAFLSEAGKWDEPRSPRFSYFPLLAVAADVQSGNRLGGEISLARLQNYWKGGIVYFRYAQEDYEKRLSLRLLQLDSGLYDNAVRQLLGPLPGLCRLRFLDALHSLDSRSYPALEYDRCSLAVRERGGLAAAAPYCERGEGR